MPVIHMSHTAQKNKLSPYGTTQVYCLRDIYASPVGKQLLHFACRGLTYCPSLLMI